MYWDVGEAGAEKAEICGAGLPRRVALWLLYSVLFFLLFYF